MDTKADIRSALKIRRNSLPVDQVHSLGVQILQHALGLDVYQSATRISSYVSIDNEANTWRLIGCALESGKRVAVPVVSGTHELLHIQISSLNDLAPSATGLLEPKLNPDRSIGPEDFDLVFVPGLAFDRRGHRVGFGEGYYDRFLARVAAPKIGLGYAFQVLDEVPADPLDVPVDRIVTESGVLICRVDDSLGASDG